VAGACTGKIAVTIASIAMVWIAMLLIAYVYVGYPVLLWIITRCYRRPVRREYITPRVTLIISAFNEAKVIGQKLENAMALDYPSDRLEILVVSDASEDGTDAIVESFRERGVTLLRMAKRQGKTAGLNGALRQACGEIVVFSDANILYQKDAIRRLVRNFADPEVGCVTGDSRYAENLKSAAHLQENTYWQYEQMIRALESRLGSTVGGDGAIFSIRRDLFRPLSPDAINDLVIPLQVVALGYRAVFEPTAVGFEPSAGNFAAEFRRKRRIVNRSWRGVLSVSEVLNPWSVGMFAWQVWSHKVLRWFVFPMVLVAGIGCFLAIPAGLIYQAGALGFVASVIIAVVGCMSQDRLGWVARLAHGLFYFYMVNLASFLGIMMAMFGRVQVTWTPEAR
jgi:cellulose synthase/poly-beta-1,6-N-acetylglucosamine synthase-like glycosyltransferase